jgi:p21-activated kinase 1
MDAYYAPEDGERSTAPKPGRRLQKQPPPVSFHNSKQTSLRRAPSAPTYPAALSYTNHTNHSSVSPSAFPAPPSGASSSTSLLRHKSSASPVYSARSSPQPLSQTSLFDKRPTPELVGKPFDAEAVYRNIGASSTGPPPRPQPPQHAHTSAAEPLRAPKSYSKSPGLRQSASFSALARTTMETITPPRSDGGTKSPRQRYSDEADAALKSKNRRSDGGKKKGAFSSFVNSVLGSPRRPTISTPTNPMHVTHVSIDNETGEFTVCTLNPIY